MIEIINENQGIINPENVVAKFSKVSLDEYIATWKKLFGDTVGYNEEIVTAIWNSIKLPERSTTGSAGYDFYTPFGFTMKCGDAVMIPTGIRCEFDVNYGMLLLPRSGLGTKHRLMIANTVPLIDSDYFHADNEGHIMLKLVYDGIEAPAIFRSDFVHTPEGSNGICLDCDENINYAVRSKPISFSQNDRIVQAVFVKLGFADEDEVTGKRMNGLGSTGN